MYNLYVDAVVVLARCVHKTLCIDCWNTPEAAQWTKVLWCISFQFTFLVPLELNSLVSKDICRLWGNAVLLGRSISIFLNNHAPYIFNIWVPEDGKNSFLLKHLYVFGFIILQATSPRLDGHDLQEARLFWNLSMFFCLLYRSLKKIKHTFKCGVESGWRGS